MSGSARTRRWLGHGLCVIILTHAAVRAAEPMPSSQIDAGTVRALLTRLDSAQAADRAAAAKELQMLGVKVLPYLPPPDRLDSAAARDTVIHLRNTLERQLARESAQPAIVTLQRVADRAALCNELTQQTGNVLAMSAHAVPLTSQVEWKYRPFWSAVEDLFDPKSERVSWQTATNRFEIGPRPDGLLPSVAHAGVFRVEAVVGKVKRVPDGMHSLLRVVTTWQAEPRLRPLFLRIKPADWQGTVGESAVSAWNPDAEYELPFGDGARQLTWPLDLLWPAVNDGKTWSLQGRAAVHLAAMTETITFDAVALRPNVQRRRGGVAVRMRKVDFRPAENGKLEATIRIHISYDTGGPAFESHRAGVFYQGASLFGPNGDRIAFTDYDATQEADGAVGAEYRFLNLPGRSSDYRFAYEAPTLFLDIPLEVRWNDLPVPE